MFDRARQAPLGRVAGAEQVERQPVARALSRAGSVAAANDVAAFDSQAASIDRGQEVAHAARTVHREIGEALGLFVRRTGSTRPVAASSPPSRPSTPTTATPRSVVRVVDLSQIVRDVRIEEREARHDSGGGRRSDLRRMPRRRRCLS